MYMGLIDWAIVLALLAFIVSAAFYTKRYTSSVADFLAANRCAGRYLLTISEGIAGVCAISVVAWFEMYYAAGFTATWWEMAIMPALMFLALTGFVAYRFRETRALTLAQFFEARYSRNFRVFAGIVLWVSGIVNFGIFPSVGARFFIHFCGLPPELVGVPTYPLVMGFLLGVSLLFVFLGGQIAVMVTDFFQGMFTNVVFLVILIGIFLLMDWSSIVDTLMQAPETASRLNPYKTEHTAGFGPWYFIIQIITVTYGWRAWQGSQAYYSSAKSAHEARMATTLAQWRGLIMMLVLVLLPVTAYAIMNDSTYAGIQTQVNERLAEIPSTTIQTQMTVPVILSQVLPVGMMGLFCAVMLAAFISTHDTYLHSWGSIFVQDVLLPLRKKPFTPKQHLMLLRLSILAVAIFIFVWSLVFPQSEYIRMFFAISGAIWLGGAGAVIIGGLYWKHGSTGGAYAAVGVGAGVAVVGIFLQLIWQSIAYPLMAGYAPWLLSAFTAAVEGVADHVWGINWTVTPEAFPLDGQWVNFFAIVLAIVAYIGVSMYSWLRYRQPGYDMDRLLHRGKYAVASDGGPHASVSGWRAMLPNDEFTPFDKFIYYANLAWGALWVLVFLVGTIAMRDVPEETWATFWYINLMVTVVLGSVTTLWFFVGGIFDIRNLFRILSTLKRDHSDDGRVEAPPEASFAPIPAAAPVVDPAVTLSEFAGAKDTEE